MYHYFRMGLLSSANRTVCNQIVSIFESNSNETSVCSSLGDAKSSNEVLYIIGLLLAPIFACLTIAMFLFVVYVASQISDYFSKVIIRFQGKQSVSKDVKVNDRKRSIVLVEDIEEEPPRKPPRFANSST